MKKTLLVLTLALLFVGCAIIKKGIPKPEFTLLKAKEDLNAVKVEGDIAENMKNLVEDATVCLKNEVKKMTANRDMINTNDTEIFTAQIELHKYQTNVWRNLCLALLGVILLCMRQLFVIFKKYLFHKEQLYMKINSEEEREKLKQLQKRSKKNV